MITIKNNEDYNICTKCGGNCCKSMSCECHPDDIFKDKEPTSQAILEILLTGNFSIDWWEGDPRELDWNDPNYVNKGYFIRPRHKEHKKEDILDPSYGGECCFLTETGCSLSWEDRPFGGKSLVPASDFMCKSNFGKKEAAIAWIPYHKMIEDAIMKYFFEVHCKNF